MSELKVEPNALKIAAIFERIFLRQGADQMTLRSLLGRSCAIAFHRRRQLCANGAGRHCKSGELVKDVSECDERVRSFLAMAQVGPRGQSAVCNILLYRVARRRGLRR